MTTVAHIAFNRPEAGNSLNLDLARHFRDEVDRAIADDAAVIVLSADGPLFCGGGDVAAIAAADDPSAYTKELADTLHGTLMRIAETSTTFVVAVNGAAAGAGLGVVLNADLVIASDKAVFTSAYTALGVSPDGGTSFLLPKVVGKTRASQLILGGGRIDAHVAKAWGIVSEVVAADELGTHVTQVAERMQRVPAAALRASKRLLIEPWIDDYRTHLARESASITELMASPESQALQQAFLAK